MLIRMSLILIACIQLLLWVEVYPNLPTYPGYHPTFSCDNCAKPLNKFCCERPETTWKAHPNEKVCCDFPAERQGMCKNEGEGCGVRSTSEKVNNTLQQIMKRTMDYINQGKCCDGLICQKGSQRESKEPKEPEEIGGSCVKGELKKLNEPCEPLLDQCLPGLTCVHRVRTEERMQIPNTNQFYERIEHRNKTAICRPGKDEGESCESDKDCQEELTCMKYVRVEHVNPGSKDSATGRLQFRIFDNVPRTRKIGKCMRGPVEHQSCNVNNDCCVKQNVKDCDLECVTNFRKLIRKNVTETRGMNMKQIRKLHIEDSATNKKLGKCLPRGPRRVDPNVCLEQPCGSPCRVPDPGNGRKKGFCSINKYCEEFILPTSMQRIKDSCTNGNSVPDTDYTYDIKCCETKFKENLKDMYVRECIGLCRDTRNIQSRQQQPIPVVCDPVRKIPDQMCRVKREMMP